VPSFRIVPRRFHSVRARLTVLPRQAGARAPVVVIDDSQYLAGSRQGQQERQPRCASGKRWLNEVVANERHGAAETKDPAADRLPL
jgi:hypothetical protein